MSLGAPEALAAQVVHPEERPPKRRSKGSLALWIVVILGMLYLFIPLITIAVFTFNDPTGKFNTTWEGFTLQNWLHPFKDEAFTDALIESVKVAIISCTLATILGTLIALALSRYRMHGGAAINL